MTLCQFISLNLHTPLSSLIPYYSVCQVEWS